MNIRVKKKKKALTIHLQNKNNKIKESKKNTQKNILFQPFFILHSAIKQPKPLLKCALQDIR